MDVSSALSLGRNHSFHVGSAADPVVGSEWWRTMDCRQGIKVLKVNTDPKAREAVLIRRLWALRRMKDSGE